jgi:hypothetical protein
LRKEKKKKARERVLSNSAFNHSLNFLRLTCINREKDVSSCLVITLLLFLIFSSGALLYGLTKSRFPLLFLFFFRSHFFFATTTHDIITLFFILFSTDVCPMHESIEMVLSFVFFSYNKYYNDNPTVRRTELKLFLKIIF